MEGASRRRNKKKRARGPEQEAVLETAWDESTSGTVGPRAEVRAARATLLLAQRAQQRAQQRQRRPKLDKVGQGQPQRSKRALTTVQTATHEAEKARERKVLDSVLQREHTLGELEEALGQGCRSAKHKRACAALLREVARLSLVVAEAIAEWQALRTPGTPALPFVFNNADYLKKLGSDLALVDSNADFKAAMAEAVGVKLGALELEAFAFAEHPCTLGLASESPVALNFISAERFHRAEDTIRAACLDGPARRAPIKSPATASETHCGDEPAPQLPDTGCHTAGDGANVSTQRSRLAPIKKQRVQGQSALSAMDADIAEAQAIIQELVDGTGVMHAQVEAMRGDAAKKKTQRNAEQLKAALKRQDRLARNLQLRKSELERKKLARLCFVRTRANVAAMRQAEAERAAEQTQEVHRRTLACVAVEAVRDVCARACARIETCRAPKLPEDVAVLPAVAPAVLSSSQVHVLAAAIVHSACAQALKNLCEPPPPRVPEQVQR